MTLVIYHAYIHVLTRLVMLGHFRFDHHLISFSSIHRGRSWLALSQSHATGSTGSTPVSLC